jgi:hypothetical protein
MAQLLLLGTNFVNFVGLDAWTGLDGGFQATRVTEWDEPQAVIGSYLQRYAYPDYWRLHVDKNKRELIDWTRSGEHFGSVVQRDRRRRRAASRIAANICMSPKAKGGFRVYDVASIGNKGVSEKITTAPFSPLGQKIHVPSRNATCVALPTNQPINPLAQHARARAANQEQAFDPIYRYAVITDSEEGLILVDVTTLADGDPRNNFLRRAMTWNEAAC